MRASPVVVRLVLGQDAPQMSFAEDQHPVGDLRPGCEHEPFRISIRARSSRRDLHNLDAGAGQGRIERRGELPSPVADQEPEARGPVTEIHQEIADLLGSPRPVWVRGHPEDGHVAGTGLEDEQAVQAPEGRRAVHVKEAGGQHGRGLGVQEPPPGRICASLESRRDPQRLEDPAYRGRAARWPSLSNSLWIRWYPYEAFSAASRSMSTAISTLTGGRPVRFG